MWQQPHKLIVNTTTRTIVCEELTIAERAFTRARGLLGRSAMRPGEGLLLRPAPSIHTAFMRFPIDVAFLDGDLRVLKLVAWLPPWRIAAARGARAALELEAGAIARSGLDVGDGLRVLDLHAWRSDQSEVSGAHR